MTKYRRRSYKKDKDREKDREKYGGYNRFNSTSGKYKGGRRRKTYKRDKKWDTKKKYYR